MAYFKEIVTKAVIGKGKKTTSIDHKIETDDNINTVLGCWVINHNFNGVNTNNKIGTSHLIGLKTSYTIIFIKVPS